MARRLHQKQTFLFGHRRGSYPAAAGASSKPAAACFAAEGGLGRWATGLRFSLGGPRIYLGSMFTSDIHFTIMVIFLDTRGGLNGKCLASPSTSCSVCLPGGNSICASVCPAPK